MSKSNEIAILEALEQKILWLSIWMIHHANHLRDNSDSIKVGGHQASCASIVTVMTALFLRILKPEDRIAVKPHAGPVFHAIQYLLGEQSLDNLKNFRGFGGAQPYPSKTKDKANIDFSTGSVGLGVAETLFASLVQDYLHSHLLLEPNKNKGKMIALVGDAELDEGNIFEALLEGWKHEIRNCWWIIDYNRQSLDGVINDKLFNRITGFFSTVNWKVIALKYGLKLQAAFKTKIGPALKNWIDECPNETYSALTFQGGNAWREELKKDLSGSSGLKEFLDSHNDIELNKLMTNLGGHDIGAILNAFQQAESSNDPHCFIAYTIKGYKLPLAGHKDNHAGILNSEQVSTLRNSLKIKKGMEWEKFSGINIDNNIVATFLDSTNYKKGIKNNKTVKIPPKIKVPELFLPKGEFLSTQESFGKIMNELGRGKSEIAQRIVTTSPDVTVSTNLGGWVNHRSPFHIKASSDIFRQMHLPSPQKWSQRPSGQHIELGIAENNLFLLLGALGLSHNLFNQRLIPIGTIYDTFIARGLDAMTYACYQDARFLLIATPSGISLGPEGGAHQSIFTPLIGIGHPNLVSFEPAYADELRIIMTWAMDYMQSTNGSSVYIRLSTKPIEQKERKIDSKLKNEILKGAYWISPPKKDAEIIIIFCGAVAPEAHKAFDIIREDIPEAGLLNVTSPDRLYYDWTKSIKERREGKVNAKSYIESLLSMLPSNSSIITLHDGHPLSLNWLGSVLGQKCYALGVQNFGEAGNIRDLYKKHNIDSEAVVDTTADIILQKNYYNS